MTHPQRNINIRTTAHVSLTKCHNETRNRPLKTLWLYLRKILVKTTVTRRDGHRSCEDNTVLWPHPVVALRRASKMTNARLGAKPAKIRPCIMYDNVYTFMHDIVFLGKTHRKLFSHTQMGGCVGPSCAAATPPFCIHHVEMSSYASLPT